MWLNKMKPAIKKGVINHLKHRHFEKRWPADPKVVFFGPPNSFKTELEQRLAIDLGVPIISMRQIY
jgi:AAA+ superfamily predicted ATPase